MLELIDVSHHQGAIDFGAVIADGISGVIVKATEGRAPTVDARFAENWAAITERRDQLVRGAYSFARPNTDGGGAEDGRAESKHFCLTLLDAGADGDYIAALDFERSGTAEEHTAQRNLDFIGAWVETCERLLGRSPWVYTGVNTWRNCCDWSSRFVRLPLWQASYTTTLPEMPWPAATLWQYTGKGSVGGVQGNVDRNRFDGTLAQLQNLARPQIYPSAPLSDAGIFAPVDLASLPSSTDDPRVRLVQGMLLGQGYGPDGLVGSDGLPDGKPGTKTKTALSEFRTARGFVEGTIVDGGVWWALVLPPS